MNGFTNNKSYLVQLCKKAYMGETQLPPNLDFWSCYRLLFFEPPPFQCDWGHHPYSCTACVRNCLPYKKCAHHGFKH